MTQQEVAAYLNVRQSTYSQYEAGKRQIPLAQLVKLALFYHTSTDYLLGLTDETAPYPRR